ncbi:hypothetical protein NIE88_14450 [Sporolactobacillus shoreicorticis]|uniref:DUF4276 family protein n=1 Tax=Sporolactobacillus shoreicorticis TaxID=1923877 RepID=A0ABW5S8U5_9BACL|nr:hypothetical protein [Sporolactobacillus shoreicorticis]MCO7126969.1 hypothetical protein [Sporolactobacillus shoreicorticis]
MAEKKVIVFIVEGVSDERTIAAIRNYVPSKYSVYVHITRGDMFTRPGMRKNVKTRVMDQIRKIMNETKYRKQEILAVIQLTDTDGAFVNDKAIEVNASVGRAPIYRESRIVVANSGIQQYIQKRNKIKASELRTMCSEDVIMNGIYYFIFYFSCNLDHVMHNNRNMAIEEKINQSRAFERACHDQPEHFYHFFHDQSFAVRGSIDDTWDFIERGTHSLQRYSNFHLIFDLLDTLEQQKAAQENI